jgi:hypothetical protein
MHARPSRQRPARSCRRTPTTRPRPRSVSDAYKEDDGNPAYASDLESLLLSRKPDIWVHGHVHNSNGYQIGKTRVVTNPKGYGPSRSKDGIFPKIENRSFDPALLIEVYDHDGLNPADPRHRPSGIVLWLGRHEPRALRGRALRDQPHGNCALRRARAPGLRASGARDQERAKPRKIRRLSHEGLVSISANHYNVPDGVGPRSASAWPPRQLARPTSCVGPTCFWTPAPSHIASPRSIPQFC